MRKIILLRLTAVLFVLLTLVSCSTKPTDTGVLRADLDAMRQELDKVIEENARLLIKIDELEIELEKQKLLLEETEAELAQMEAAIPEPSVPQPSEVVPEAASEPDPSASAPTLDEPDMDTAPDLLPSGAMLSAELPENSQSPQESAQPEAEATSPAPTPQPSQPVVVGDTVYITKTGKKYHTNPACNGGTYYECSLDDAIAKGLTPCKRCAGG